MIQQVICECKFWKKKEENKMRFYLFLPFFYYELVVK